MGRVAEMVADGALSRVDRRLDALAGQRQVAQALARSMGNGVGERRRGRSLACLSATEKWRARVIDDVNFDRIRNGGKAEDWIGRPIDEGNTLVKGPARRLQDRTFDLIGEPVR